MIKIMLSKLLGERRMKQSELSKKTGIRPNTILELYHDYAKRISLSHLEKICKVLDCSICDLLVIEPDDPEGKRETKARKQHFRENDDHENQDIIIKK